MTRGRRPLEAIKAATRIAEKRGQVQRYQHRRGNTCDFTIMSPGLIAFITVKRLERLSVLPEDIIHDFTAVIALLRFIVSSPGISRELWLRTPHGAWRFFRVLENGIIELDRDGKVLENGKGLVKTALPATGPAKNADKKPGTRKKPGRKRKAGAGMLPEHMDADNLSAKDQKPAVIDEKYGKAAKNPEEKNTDEPAKNPGPEINQVPYLISQKNPGPEKNLSLISIPEKFVVPVQDPGSATDPEQPPEPEKVPEIIKKYLKWRMNGLEKDPELE